MVKIKGVSKKTLVEDNELFLFDDEVEPILSVLCGKTLEQARMEVLEEEELATMKREQTKYQEMDEREAFDVKTLEDQERYRLEEYQKKKLLEKGRRMEKKRAHEKIVCRQISK